MTRKKIWIDCLLAFCLMFLAIPGRRAEAAGKESKVAFSKNYGTVVMKKGAQKSLSATCNKKKISASKLKWKSSKQSVVSVKNGKLTAKKSGSATISVRLKKEKSNTVKCKVYVYTKKKSTDFTAKLNDEGRYLLNKGKTVDLKMEKKGSYTTFASSNEKVATVSSKGTVKAKKAGVATITGISVGSYRYQASIKVEVGTRIKGIKISGDEFVAGVEEQLKLNAKVSPSGASVPKLSYTSGDSDVATVSDSGVVKTWSEGMAVITIKARDGSGVEKKVRVYVAEVADSTGTTLGNVSIAGVEDNAQWVAHRGLNKQAPENTLPAFELAGKAGFAAIECDVRETLDGALVISHDASLQRMCGVDKKVADLTLAQIKQYSVTGGKNAQKYPNNKIPTLQEYIQCCNQYGCVPMIEVKTPISDAGIQELYGLLSLSEKSPIVISFDDSVLKTLRGMDKQLSLQKVMGELTAADLKKCKTYRWNVDLRYINVTRSIVQKVHKEGLLINVWTVNDKGIAKVLRQWGVDYISSDGKLF